ncbi:MAG: DNA polymerase [bacterium]
MQPQTLRRAYAEGRVLDTDVLRRLAEIQGAKRAHIRSLADLHRYYGLGELAKDDAVRLTYGQYLGSPVTSYTPEHVVYALSDATATLRLWQRMRERHPDVKLPDVAFCTRKMFCLHLQHCWGIETDPDRVTDLARLANEHIADLRGQVQQYGFVRDDGSKCMARIKAAVLCAYRCTPDLHVEFYKKWPDREKHVSLRGWWEPDGRYVSSAGDAWTDPFGDPSPAADQESVCPVTAKGGVATAAWVLRESGDPLLRTFAEYGEWSAVINKDMGFLSQPILHTSWALADTLRVISSKPNLLNLRRKAGVRECFRARPGMCIVSIDWKQGEVVTLAEHLVSRYGEWGLAQRVQAGVDDHVLTASTALGLSYDAFAALVKAGDKDAKDMRQCAKIEDFGKPGGMGPETMMRQARAIYGISKPLEFWRRLDEAWKQSHPDVMAHLRGINQLQEPDGKTYADWIPGTSVFRRGMTYCSAANNPFQSLLAVIAGHVMWLIVQEQYFEPGSPLFGTRVLLHPHDEFLVECRPEQAHDVAARLEQLMTEGLGYYLPHVPIGADACAMVLWSKDARAVYKDGRLWPCCPACNGKGCDTCKGTGCAS